MFYAILIIIILWLIHRNSKLAKDAQQFSSFLGAYIDHGNSKSTPRDRADETKRILDTLDYKTADSIYERFGRAVGVPVSYDDNSMVSLESEQEILRAIYRK